MADVGDTMAEKVLISRIGIPALIAILAGTGASVGVQFIHEPRPESFTGTDAARDRIATMKTLDRFRTKIDNIMDEVHLIQIQHTVLSADLTHIHAELDAVAPIVCDRLRRAILAHVIEVFENHDEEYYADLWVNSHESCPDWSPPADVAAADDPRTQHKPVRSSSKARDLALSRLARTTPEHISQATSAPPSIAKPDGSGTTY